MNDLIITIDSGSNLNIDCCNKYNIIPLKRNYIFNDKICIDNLNKEEYLKTYKDIKKGKKSLLMSINQYAYLDFWYTYLRNNKSIIHISIGDKEFKSATLAKKMLEKEFKDLSIYIIQSNQDSLNAGMLAIYASKLRDSNTPILNIYETINEKKNNVIAYCTNNKNIKKNNLSKMFDVLKNNISYADILFILHSDNISCANEMGSILQNKYGIKNIEYNYIAPYKCHQNTFDQICVFFLQKNKI